MHFIRENGYDIREGQDRAYQSWLAENEAAIADACPEGVEYIGTFYAVHSDDRTGGQYRMLWRLDSYGAQDRLAAEVGGDTPFARLTHEAMRFMDMRPGANRSNHLLKRVTDSTVLLPED